MLSKKLPLALVLLLIAGTYNSNAQNLKDGNKETSTTAKSSWKIAPFDSKVFIRNEGQADGKIPSNEKILFQASVGSIDAYFTGKGVVYRCDEYPIRDKDEDNGKEKPAKPKTYYLTAEWQNSNPGVMITADEEQSYYHCFGMGMNSSIKANVFKKITYHNLYPGIDVEYFFPEGKSGIKYTVIVHPGADMSLVKIQYKGAKGLTVDRNGNVVVKTDKIGDITDHAPVSYYEGEKNKIATKYVIKGNEESFSSDDFIDGTKTMVIDPWSTDPKFSTSSGDNAYDVDYDNQGNVYAYGGGGTGIMPKAYNLVKINSAGVKQWEYTNGSAMSSQIYGDFAVDKATGTSYVVGPPGTAAGSVVEKVNTTGSLTGSYVTNILEMWRATYNGCTHSIMVGTGSTSVSAQAVMIDTNMTANTPVNVLSATDYYHDVCLIATDPTGGAGYVAVAKNTSNSNFDNVIAKIPIPALSPTTYITSDGYNFTEIGSVTYAGTPGTNGMNGMAASPNWLYLYDGATLKKFNKATGAQVGSNVTVTGTSFSWGGLDVDGCDNIYVGENSAIQIYNSSMSLVSTLPLTSTVYDVVLGNNDQVVYAGGKGFVQAVSLVGVLPTPPVQITKTVTQPTGGCSSCNGSATASLKLCGSPAVGATYKWSNGQTTSNATGLCGGTYTVTITPAFNTCGGTTYSDTVNINGGGGGSGPTATNAITTPKCHGGTGTVTANASGGTGPYTYNWSSGQTTSSVSNLATGSYTCTIKDKSGCTYTDTLTIVNPATINASISGTTQASCGSNNGSATVSASGGTGTLTYNWTPSGGTNATAINLGSGSYTCTITDANGCTQTATANISNTGGPTVSATVTNPKCNGSTGTGIANVISGTAPYSYTWPGGTTHFDSSATGLVAGTYICVVADKNGCKTNDTIKITQPTAITATVTPTNSTCGSNNGSATIVASGGTGTLTYSWTPSGGTNATASGLAAGGYTCTVTDASGCSKPFSTNIVTNGGPSISSITRTDLLCNGTNTGTATANATGGVTPYTYNWSSGQTTSSVSNLAVGTYTCTVKDKNGCQTMDTVIITQPNAITASISGTTQANCGASNGSATATASGGTGALKYSWNTTPVQTTAAATGLPSGSYTCTVTDANGCSKTVTTTITNTGGATVTSTTTDPKCNGGTGTAVANATGGATPYTYNWSSGQTTSSVNNLAAGSYTCTVKDNNGCIATDTLTITQPAAIGGSAFVTNASCGASDGSAVINATGGTGAYTYSWSGGQTTSSITTQPAGSYTCTVTDANNCTGKITALISNNGAPTVSAGQVNEKCFGDNIGTATVNASGGAGGYTYSWNGGQTTSSISNLTAGTYTCTVTDSKGCSSIDTVKITQPAALASTINPIAASCGKPGSASVTALGGTGPYTYSWNTTPAQTTSTITNLVAGGYTCIVTDANNCVQTLNTTITGNSGPVVTISSDTTIQKGGSVTLVSTGGGTYQWTPSTGLSCDTCATTIASPTKTTSYCVLVTDKTGCADSTCMTITVDLPCGEIFVPNAFSPNGDNQNDLECVYGGCITTIDFSIFDRWGNRVFHTTEPLQNCWDGKYNGQVMNTGVFVYYLNAVLDNGDKVTKKGNITLVR